MKIKSGKERSTLGDLKTADKVTVKYIMSDGRNMAKGMKIKNDSKKSGEPKS